MKYVLKTPEIRANVVSNSMLFTKKCKENNIGPLVSKTTHPFISCFYASMGWKHFKTENDNYYKAIKA